MKRVTGFVLILILCTVTAAYAGPVHQAVIDGRVSEVLAALKQYPDQVNAVDQEGETPLHYAARRQRADIARVLLRNGADPNASDRFGQTPLHMALESHGDVKWPHIVEVLLDGGADINAANSNGMTPLYRALYDWPESVGELMISRSRVLHVVAPGLTPLHMAARRGLKRIARMSLARGVDIDARYSAPTGELSGLGMALAGVRPAGRGETALQMAIESGHEGIAMLLIGRRADITASGNGPAESLLCLAASQDMKRVASALIRRGADVNSPWQGASPLSWARSRAMIELLVAHGADVNGRDEHGETPLFQQRNSCPEAVRALIDSGADVNAVGELGYTPLHRAAGIGVPQVADILLSAGARVSVPNSAGRTPLHLAASEGNRSIVDLLISHGAEIDARDSDGRTPLHLAARAGCISCVEALVLAGAGISQADNLGMTPAQFARVGAPVPPRTTVLEGPLTRAAREYAVRFLDGLSSGASAAKLSRHTMIVEPELRAAREAIRRTGAVVRRYPYLTAATPCWSPDSRLVATHESIWNVEHPESPVRVRALERGAWTVGFSPDGAQFAYIRFAKESSFDGQRITPPRGYADLCVVPAGRGRVRVVARNVLCASWSPRGDRLAYLTFGDHDVQWLSGFDVGEWLHVMATLCVSDSDGGHTKSIGAWATSVVSGGSFGGGGGQFGTSGGDGGSPGGTGTADRKVRSSVLDRRLAVEAPVWSPDGERIALVVGGAIRTIGADGYGQRRLRVDADEFGSLAWSQDGRELSFIAIRGTDEYLMAVDAKTGEVKGASGRLNECLPELPRSGSWSPDRTSIALLLDQSQNEESYSAVPQTDGIWIARRDGSGIFQIASVWDHALYAQDRTEAEREHPFWSRRQTQPAWSPDGRKIAVVHPSAPEVLHVLLLQ